MKYTVISKNATPLCQMQFTNNTYIFVFLNCLLKYYIFVFHCIFTFLIYRCRYELLLNAIKKRNAQYFHNNITCFNFLFVVHPLRFCMFQSFLLRTSRRRIDSLANTSIGLCQKCVPHIQNETSAHFQYWFPGNSQRCCQGRNTDSQTCPTASNWRTLSLWGSEQPSQSNGKRRHGILRQYFPQH